MKNGSLEQAVPCEVVRPSMTRIMRFSLCLFCYMPGCPVRLAGNRPPSVGGCRLLLRCDWTTRPYGGITRIKLTVEASLPLSLAAPVRLRLHHSPDRVTSRPAAGLRGLSKSLELVMIVVTKRQGMMMARCARCGNEIPAGSVFCTYCGIPVASGVAAAPGSGAQMPQPGTAASGFAPNTVPGTGTLPPVRSQRARITAAAHPKVSPGRNPNPARSHHLRPRNARSARSSSPSSRPSSSWRSSSAELPHSSSFTAGRTRPRPRADQRHD